MGTRGGRRAVIALGVLVASVSALGVGSSTAQEATGTLIVSPESPVGFQPVELSFSGSGCDAGAEVRVELLQEQVGGDTVALLPLTEVALTADPDGAWSGQLTLDRPPPGRFHTALECAGPQYPGTLGSFDVGLVEAPTITANPSRIELRQPTTLTLAGTGCVEGVEAAWKEYDTGPISPPSAPAGYLESSGTIAVDAIGGFAGDITVEPDGYDVPDRAPATSFELEIACVYDTTEAELPYLGSYVLGRIVLQVIDSSPPPPVPPVVQPTYTG